MRFFTMLLDPEDRGISDNVRRTYEVLPRRRGLEFKWQAFDHAAVLTAWDDPWGQPLVASDGSWLATGMVRLDNRSSVECAVNCAGQGLSDLDLVLRLVARYGTKQIPRVWGDFAFVIWDGSNRTLTAVAEPFGVKNLYYALCNGLVTFGSRAESLAPEEAYDIGYLTEMVSVCNASPELTVYERVRRVPPGFIVETVKGHLTSREYWSPLNVHAGPTMTNSEAIETCRQLLTTSVRLRMPENADTWAQLSGGLDSSSVVSLAQWDVERGAALKGLAGTVTYVDGEGSEGDERPYSQALVQRWSLRNEQIVDAPIWHDDSALMPWFDQPTFTQLVYPREQRLSRIVRQAGGRVLLTGLGGDELFTGNALFLLDMLVQGRIVHALREMVHRAAIRRLSFWELAYRTVLLPLLPRQVQHHLLIDNVRLPAWMTQTVIKRSDVKERLFAVTVVQGSLGQKYRHAFVRTLETLRSMRGYGTLDNELDVRHPFLYRPLVEFALNLAPDLCTRPESRKWILREAMRGILPELVRERVGKGNSQSVTTSALTTQRAALEPLIQDPILADLGVIDAGKFRAAFNAAPHCPERKSELQGMVMVTLMIEAWLQLRAGRWPRRAK